MKKLMTLFILIISFLVLVGCSSLTAPQIVVDEQAKPEQQQEISKNDEELSKQDNDQSTNQEVTTHISDSGIYSGRADSNSIEIKVNDEFKVFRLSEELKISFDDLGLQMNEAVEFKYTVNQHGQGVISEITRTESDYKTDTGRYSGRADSNFIEIKISGVPEEMSYRMFMLSEELKKDFDSLNFQIDEVVKFNYIVNEHDQQVIFQITRI